MLHRDFVPTFLLNKVQHLFIAPNNDLTCSHYLFQYDKTVNRLERYIREATTYKCYFLNLHGQFQLELPPPSFYVYHVVLCLPSVGSPLTLRYLGQYSKLFNDPVEKHAPTWTTVSWLLEDYDLSRTKDVPTNIHYRRITRQWSLNPLLAMINHPHFCSCPRRYKWNPHAILTSIEYNWPIIPGTKTTAANC